MQNQIDVIYTIGFSKKTAQIFFDLLKNTQANKIIDIRLNNNSQLAGFAKKNDLIFFLKKILNWEYLELKEAAPTKELLSNYQNKNITWQGYEHTYHKILLNRNLIENLSRKEIINSVFLCSEEKPDFCHRRLFTEYLQKHWENIEIIHLF